MDSEEKIWKYIDQLMDAKERKNFERDMASSNALREQFGKINQLHDQLSKQDLLQPTQGFTDRVMSALPATLNRAYVYSAQKLKPYLIGFLVISLLYLIVGVLAGSQQGPVEDWFAQHVVMPSLSYSLPAGAGAAIVILLAADQLLQRRLKA